MTEILSAIVTTPDSAAVSSSGAVHDAWGTLAGGAAKGVIAAGNMADNTAEVGLSITAFAATNIEKGTDVIPTGLHTLSAVFLKMPMGPILVATVILSMTVSVYGSRYIDMLVSWNTGPLRHIRFMKGHDAGFAATYIVSTTMALIMLFAISMISMRVQIPLLMAVGASIIGVVGSVSVDTIMSAADPDGLREEEKTRTSQTSRRVYLHGSMALLSAFLAYGIFIARA